MRVLGISGSLRSDSHNTSLLRHAGELFVAEGAQFSIYDGLRELPIYDEDLDVENPHVAVARIREAVGEADAVFFATPEYNSSIPGGLKNAIDWLSRPALASVLRWKPVAIMGASSGRGGTKYAQQQVRDALLFPGAVVLDEPVVRLPVAWERFDPDLKLTDENAGAAITELLTELVGLASQQPQVVAA
jgi:chromate reductase